MLPPGTRCHHALMAIDPADQRSTAPRIATLGPDDAEAMVDVDRWAFPVPDFDSRAGDLPQLLSCFEWDRTRGAYLPDLDGEQQLVGINPTYSIDLPVPGGSVACAGLTWVGVNPAFRRRGV